YTKLKTAIIARTRKQESISCEPLLGDTRPTQLWRRMVTQAEALGEVSAGESAVLKSLFVQRLPQEVRLVLAPELSRLSAEEIAERADKVQEFSVSQSIQSVEQTSSSVASDIQKLTEQVAQLT